MGEPPEKSSSLNLGLAELLSSSATQTDSKPTPAVSSVTVTQDSPPASSDPYTELASNQRWSELETLSQAHVEKGTAAERALARIWWTRAMFEQRSMPIPILLAPLEQSLQEGMLHRDVALLQACRKLARRFAEEGFADAAELVGGAEFRLAPPELQEVAAKSAPTIAPDSHIPVRESYAKRIVIAVVMLMLIVFVGYYFLSPERGALAPVILSEADGAGTMRGPVMPSPVPASELATLLLRLDKPDASSSNSSANPVGSSSSVSSVAATGGGANPARQSATPEPVRKRAVLNVDGPTEPDAVKRAIEQGDPTEQRDTGEILFGRSQSVSKTTAPIELEKFERILTVRALTRCIITREPTFESLKIGSLKPGDTVLVDGRMDSWFRVRLPSGGQGYVLAQDVDRVD